MPVGAREVHADAAKIARAQPEASAADLSQGLAVEVSAPLVAESAACGPSLSWATRDVSVVMGLRWRSSVLTA